MSINCSCAAKNLQLNSVLLFYVHTYVDTTYIESVTEVDQITKVSLHAAM